MKIKSLDFRKIVLTVYFVSFAVFLLVGLTPAGAINYNVSGRLLIPSISLDVDVTKIEIEDGRLNTPDLIVGSYDSAPNKTFLVGHASAVFQNLKNVQVGDEIEYGEDKYVVKNTTVLEKSEIRMRKLLKAADVKTLVIMTCSGENLGGGDATHRLILTAEVV